MREHNRIESVKTKRAQKDTTMTKTQNEKDWNLMIKKEMDLIKREDRLENVDRITKATEYKKAKILEKIEFDNIKTVHV